MTPAIEIQNLTKTYKRGRREILTAVSNLSLTIEPGQIFGFLGPNGAGKTTTIKMICGLVKPSTGSIRLNGYDVARQRGQAMRQLGAVLEGTRNVYWRLSALQNLLYFGRLKGVYGKELHDRAHSLLEGLELWDRRHDKIRLFSRGMQQKVAIACAFMSDPPIVLLDEPTLGLDVKAALTVKNWIAHLAERREKTIVLTTHQLDLAQALCERVAIINHGELLVDRPMTQMLDLFRTEFYEVKIKGNIAAAEDSLQADALDPFDGLETLWADASPDISAGHPSPRARRPFDGIRVMSIQHDDDVTILSCAIHNGEEIYSLIDRLRSLDLSLISITPVEPNLEQIFINYIDGVNHTPQPHVEPIPQEVNQT